MGHLRRGPLTIAIAIPVLLAFTPVHAAGGGAGNGGGGSMGGGYGNYGFLNGQYGGLVVSQAHRCKPGKIYVQRIAKCVPRSVHTPSGH
jgi:hypothetical protein